MFNKQHSRFLRTAAVLALMTVSISLQAATPETEAAIVAGAPQGKALSVLEAKATAKDTDKIVVEGRVKDIEGQAVFTLADTKMKSCTDNGENCPTPWDYCCLSKAEITSGTATVKLVGAAGGKQALKDSLKGVKGINHLVGVTVEGTAQKDKLGNLVVLASKVYVKK